MKPDEAFSDLIGRIYDCALDTSQWERALEEITNTLGGVMADLIVSHPLEGRQTFAALYNWPDDMIAAAMANAPINPGLPLGLTVPLGRVFCSSRDLDIEAFHRSRFWQNCFAGRGIYDYVVSPVTRTVTSFATWGVCGSETKGAYTDEDLEFARLLSPHIKRAVEISGVIGRRKVEAGTLQAAMEALATPALIIEPDGRILFCNEAAARELATRQFMREHKGRLIAVTPEAMKVLTNLSSAPTRKSQKGLDALLTSSEGRTLHVTWAELEQAGEEIGSPILVLLRQPETALITPLSSAASLFHLTTSEIQVLGQVLQGHALSEAAEILGLARSTVKTHLDAIYRKTQTNRQAELVSRVMALASPIKR